MAECADRPEEPWLGRCWSEPGIEVGQEAVDVGVVAEGHAYLADAVVASAAKVLCIRNLVNGVRVNG